MLAILGSLIGLLGALAPKFFAIFENKANHKNELELLNAHTENQLKLLAAGHSTRMEEINTWADTRSELAAFAAQMRPTGIAWVDALNGVVRPLLTVSFFALYAAVKVAQFVVLSEDHSGTAATILSLWGQEDWAIWAAIVTFWFGNRTFNKERGRA